MIQAARRRRPVGPRSRGLQRPPSQSRMALPRLISPRLARIHTALPPYNCSRDACWCSPAAAPRFTYWSLPPPPVLRPCQGARQKGQDTARPRSFLWCRQRSMQFSWTLLPHFAQNASCERGVGKRGRGFSWTCMTVWAPPFPQAAPPCSAADTFSPCMPGLPPNSIFLCTAVDSPTPVPSCKPCP